MVSWRCSSTGVRMRSLYLWKTRSFSFCVMVPYLSYIYWYLCLRMAMQVIWVSDLCRNSDRFRNMTA